MTRSDFGLPRSTDMHTWIEDGVDPRGRLAVEQLLRDAVCVSVDYRRSTESTNTAALDDLIQPEHKDPRCPKLFLADEQTAGRGRHGRRWISSDSTLTFSLIVPRGGPQTQARQSSRSEPQGRAGLLVPLAAGVGVARFLETEFALHRVDLKWPNDIYLGGGKVAGVLMETSSARLDRLVIGVGLNAGQPPQLDANPATGSPQGLSQLLDQPVERYDLLHGIVTEIMKAVSQVDEAADSIVSAFRDRCLLADQVVRFQQGGGGERLGRCRGISDQGTLMVETGEGIQPLRSGEVNLVRPID